jgi:hypothetical protein
MKTMKCFLLAASFSLALALTFTACGGDDGDDNGGGGSSGVEGCKTEKMCLTTPTIKSVCATIYGGTWGKCPSDWKECSTLDALLEPSYYEQVSCE